MARKNFRVNVRTPRLLALFWRSIQSGKIPGPPPPRLLPDLPFELLGQIASFLHNDTPSLLAFASVCLTWRAASRHIRFHQITLDARRQGEHPLEKLQVLLKSDPSLGSLIRVVRAWFVIEGHPFTSFYEPWFSQLPIVLHNNLPRVHTLEIRGLGEFGELPAGNFFSELSYVASIEHLSLVHCCLRHQQLNDFITSLPNLKSLHVHNHWLATRPFNWSEFDPHNIPLPSHFPPLTTFNYHNDNASGPTSLAFLHWLSPIRTLRSVGIHIDSGDAGSILEISEFLANLGGSLEHLELRFLDKVPKLSWALNRGDDG